MLRILEDKGHVKHRREGIRYVYLPRAKRKTARRIALKRVVSTFFQGSVTQRVCMNGFSQFGLAMGDKGQSFCEIVLAHGGLEIGKG